MQHLTMTSEGGDRWSETWLSARGQFLDSSAGRVTQTEPDELKKNREAGQLEFARSRAEKKFQILHGAPLEHLGI